MIQSLLNQDPLAFLLLKHGGICFISGIEGTSVTFKTPASAEDKATIVKQGVPYVDVTQLSNQDYQKLHHVLSFTPLEAAIYGPAGDNGSGHIEEWLTVASVLGAEVYEGSHQVRKHIEPGLFSPLTVSSLQFAIPNLELKTEEWAIPCAESVDHIRKVFMDIDRKMGPLGSDDGLQVRGADKTPSEWAKNIFTRAALMTNAGLGTQAENIGLAAKDCGEVLKSYTDNENYHTTLKFAMRAANHKLGQINALGIS